MAGGFAHGLWNYALVFFESAEMVDKQEGDTFLLIPKYYLICHSLELSLKAFLNHKGVSQKDLKDKFRHNLKALFREARRLDLRKEFRFSSDQWKAILVINSYYQGKEFEYARAGSKRFPLYSVLSSAAEGLLTGISPSIRGRHGLR